MTAPVLYVPIGEDGSIALPPELREALGVRAGEEVALTLDEVHRRIAIEPRGRDIRDLFGSVRNHSGKAVSIEDMDRGIAEWVAADDARIRRGEGG